MSIISTAAAVPSRLFAIYMAVIENDREISLEELEHAMTPKSLIKRENPFLFVTQKNLTVIVLRMKWSLKVLVLKRLRLLCLNLKLMN